MRSLKKISYLIISIFIFQIFVGIVNLEQISYKSEEISSPNDAAFEDYMIEWPSIDTLYFSPQTSPGILDEVSFSFLANVDINYRVNISALPRRMYQPNIEGTSILFNNNTNKLYLFGAKMETDYTIYNYSIVMAISEDMGKSWSEYRNITNVFNDDGFFGLKSPSAVFTGNEIHLIFGYNDTKIMYMNSSDDGITWDAPKIIQNNIPFWNPSIAKIDAEVNPLSGDIHVVCDEGSMYGGDIYTFNSTDNGTTWSTPGKIPEFTSDDCLGPSLGFDSNGHAFIAVFRMGGTNRMEIREYSDGFWGGSSGSLPIPAVSSYGILSVDKENDDVYYISRDITSINYIYKVIDVASSDYEIKERFCEVTNTFDYYKADLDSYNGILFYTTKSYLLGTNDVLFEKFDEDIHLEYKEGVIKEFNKAKINWNGTTSESYFSNYTLFYFHVRLNNDTSNYFDFRIERDDDPPYIKNIGYNNQFISPNIQDGNNDELITTFTTDEEIDYTYKILSPNRTSFQQTVISSSLSIKDKPLIIMDSHGYYYAFTSKKSGYYNQIAYYKSTDGGSNWEEAVELTPSGVDVDKYDVCTDGNAIYVLVDDGLINSKSSLKKSLDGGDTWITIEISEDFYNGGFIEVGNDGVLYALKYSWDLGWKYTLYNSTNGGKTWNYIDKLPFTNHEMKSMIYDKENDNLYFTTFSSGSFQYFNTYINIPTNKTSVVTHMFDEGMDPSRRATSAMTLRPTEDGNSTVVVYAIGDTISDEKDIEQWISPLNGTGPWTMNVIGQTKSGYEDYGGYFDAKTNTDVWVTINEVDGTDVLFFDGNSTIKNFGSGRASVNVEVEISYNGKNSYGQYIDDGNYTFLLSFWDNTYNYNSTKFDFIVDNTLPNITSGPISYPLVPSPSDETNITFTIEEEYLAEVYVKYRHSIDSQWNSALISQIDELTYNATIPGDSESDELRYYFEIHDQAGNVYTDNNDGVYYGWSDISVHVTIKANGISSSISTEFNSFDEILFDVIINEGIEYIDHINLTIKTNDNSNYNLTFNPEGKIFSLEFSPPEKNSGYSFSISYLDISGKIRLLMGDTLMIPPEITDPIMDIQGILENEVTSKDLINLEISFIGDTGDYISGVEVMYSIDNGEWITVELNETNNIFNGTIGPFLVGELLTYKLVYIDSVGNRLENEVFSINIIPAMPELTITANYFTLIGVISAILGIVIGAGYMITVQRQTRDPRDIFIENFKITRKIGKNKPYNIINDPALTYEQADKGKFFNIFLISSFVIFILGLVYFMISAKYEYGILTSAGISLLTVVLFNHNMTNSITNAVKDPKMLKKTYITSFSFLIVLGVSLGLIFYVGSFIDWFNFYVNQQTISLGSIEIPSIWINIGSTFISTLMIVVISTINAVKRLIKRLADYARNGITSRNLYAIREEQLQGVLRRFMLKLVMFVVVVMASIISTTNLSTYSRVGFVIILPFLGTLLLIVLIFGYSRKKAETVKSIVINKIKCNSCGELVPEGMYCQSCGNDIITEQEVQEDTIECKICKTYNPKDSKFCRICRNAINSDK